MLKTNHRRAVRFALLVLLVGIGRVAPAPLEAAVVVLSNRTEQTVRFSAEPVWGQQKQYSLAPGKLVRIHVSDRVRVTFASANTEVEKQIDPNTVHYFQPGRERIELEQATFSDAMGGAWLHVDKQRGPPPPVVVPVKILVDAQHPAVRSVWEPRLRRQLGAASEAVELYCGVRFQVVAVETWEIDADQADLGQLGDDFRRKATPDPARLAIGFASRCPVAKTHRSWHLGQGPLYTHLLLPDVRGNFSDTKQLELLVHELGHFLGAVHSAEKDSIMRGTLPDRNTNVRGSGDTFDAVNTLLMNLIAEEIRTRGARRLDEVPRSTREYLRAIYSEMARRSPDDAEIAHAAEFVREPVVKRFRYVGQWVDGTRTTADAVEPWDETGSSPKLGGKALFDEHCPIRWLWDTTCTPADPPEAFLEFAGGDCLPGRVVAARSGTKSPDHPLPPHLLVAPYARLDLPDGPPRSHVRVTTDWLRRIVWQRIAEDYRPRTLFLRDGRQLEFRSVRLTPTGVRLLRQEGIREIPLADVAELHFPPVDPWEAYFGQLAALEEDVTFFVCQIETAGGLRATGSSERFQARKRGPDGSPAHWYHLVQPAWSLDAFWVRHQAVRLRRYFRPHEVPLSRIEPAANRQQSDLGGVWHARADRSVQGTPLESGGRAYPWGLGVHALSELEFPLPPSARRFRTQLGLDRLAGDGGCVRASIFAGSTTAKPLFQSGLIIGSADVLDSGPLPLDGQAQRQLVLRVDPAHDERPPGADPFDVRDTFDWLEPLLELDPQAVQAEVLRRTRVDRPDAEADPTPAGNAP